jgi:CheY-like chemotaxis protein
MHVLIVDDSAEFRELLIAFLKVVSPAARPSVASSGYEAIGLLQPHADIDLVICDHGMAQGNGVEVFQHIQTIPRAIPFVLFTASSDVDESDFEGKNLLGIVPKHDLPALERLLLNFEPQPEASPH